MFRAKRVSMLMATVAVMLARAASPGTACRVTVRPEIYAGGLRNPLKGFIPQLVEVKRKTPPPLEFVTLTRHCIKWCDIENDISDGVEKIRAYCDREWEGLAERNIKVVPRVYLQWSSPKWSKKPCDWWACWPADMTAGDWESEQFKSRVRGMVKKLGECWDGDPRVAWVQMAIMGAWGEHHEPRFTPETEKLFGDAFTAAFPRKKVVVRHPEEFGAYAFGINNDAWNDRNHWWCDGTGSAMKFARLIKERRRQMFAPIEGEIAYGYAPVRQWYAGLNPDDTLATPACRSRLIASIRYFGCSALGWINKYHATNAAVRAGADLVQRTWGYRYEIGEVTYDRCARPGETFGVEVRLRNIGAAPFYYRWPVTAALLDPATRAVAAEWEFETDIRDWLPGEGWRLEGGGYAKAAPEVAFGGRFQVPAGVKEGRYILALAVLDPAGRRPSLRFATRNYFKGGRHPMGFFTVGAAVQGDAALKGVTFDDPNGDFTLGYSAAANATE